MTVRDREYDRFGPWVIEVSEEDPPPPLFVPHLDRSEPEIMSIKIPRKIERRGAHPGMDFYDYMVCLYEKDMLILRRLERNVQAETLSYRDVQHLRVSENLLRGQVRLCLTGQTFDLPYNTVSRNLMVRLVDLIRERYGGRREPVSTTTVGEVEAGGLSFYFSGLLRAEQAGGSGMRLLAAQPNAAVGSHETNALRKVLFGIASKTLLESMHLCDGRELKIIGRGGPMPFAGNRSTGTTSATSRWPTSSEPIGKTIRGTTPSPTSCCALPAATAPGRSSATTTPWPGTPPSSSHRAEPAASSPPYPARLGASQRSASAMDQPLRAA